MTKAVKRLMALCMGAVIFAGGTELPAFAQETVMPKADRVCQTAEDVAADEWTAALRGAYLGRGSCSIARAGHTYVHIGGETLATKVCDTLYLTLYLERSRYYAKDYGTYKYYDYKVTDDYAVSTEISDIPIERGYYYRVKGVHTVVHNGVIETTDSVTDPIDFR